MTIITLLPLVLRRTLHTFGGLQPQPGKGNPSGPKGQGASNPGTPWSPLSPLSPFLPLLPRGPYTQPFSERYPDKLTRKLTESPLYPLSPLGPCKFNFFTFFAVQCIKDMLICEGRSVSLVR